MALVKPATVLDWHRKGFRRYWRRRSRRPGRPRTGREIRDLIRKTSRADRLRGAPASTANCSTRDRDQPSDGWQIHGLWRPKVALPTSRSFPRNHLDSTAAMDMSVVATARFRLLYALVVLGHERRKVIHFSVTPIPLRPG